MVRGHNWPLVGLVDTGVDPPGFVLIFTIGIGTVGHIRLAMSHSARYIKQVVAPYPLCEGVACIVLKALSIPQIDTVYEEFTAKSP